MLKRIYIDNYKCFSNFEFTPGPLNLLLGRNGTGKSTLFEALVRLRDFALGRRDALAAFPPETRTRWETRRQQTLTLEVESGTLLYAYTLQIEHKEHERQCRILREELTLAGQPLFAFVNGDVHLYRDDHSLGPEFPADWSRSAMATVPERRDNTHLWRFKHWLERLWVLSIDPRAMGCESSGEVGEPAREFADFASWYRHVLQEHPGELGAFFADLGRVIPGLTSLNLQKVGEKARRMTASVRLGSGDAQSNAAAAEFGLDELSDGQRMLIALYSLLHLGVRGGATLCIDEPDNFVALAEIQPWLVALRDAVEERPGTQVILISHSPEVINYLAGDCGKLFERDGNGPVRVRDFATDPASGLAPAETIARGWE